MVRKEPGCTTYRATLQAQLYDLFVASRTCCVSGGRMETVNVRYPSEEVAARQSKAVHPFGGCALPLWYQNLELVGRTT